jgi:Holliday junction resolvase RusA-like endonuclease
MSLKFFTLCELPKTTHQSGSTIMKTKAGRYFIGQNNRGKQTQRWLRLILSKEAPPSPLVGALAVHIKYYRPHLKSAPAKIKNKPYAPITTRPDCDNLAKGVLDAMQATGYFLDDAQVYKLTIEKAYAHKYGLGVEICTTPS